MASEMQTSHHPQPFFQQINNIFRPIYSRSTSPSLRKQILQHGFTPSKQTAETAAMSDHPDPSTYVTVLFTLPDPRIDPMLWGSQTECFMRLFRDRTQATKYRLAASTATEFNPTDLALNVKIIKAMIAVIIIKAMQMPPLLYDQAYPWNSQPGRAKFCAGFQEFTPTTVPGLRVLFPGAGKENGKGRQKGWRTNVYSAREFQDIVGVELISRANLEFTELKSDVTVMWDVELGVLKFSAMYGTISSTSNFDDRSERSKRWIRARRIGP